MGFCQVCVSVFLRFSYFSKLFFLSVYCFFFCNVSNWFTTSLQVFGVFKKVPFFNKVMSLQIFLGFDRFLCAYRFFLFYFVYERFLKES